MAKYAVILSVIFCLFVLSHARIPSNLPEASFNNLLPLSAEEEGKTTHLVLPTDNTDDSKNPASDTIAAIGIPRPFLQGFHPVNRHFPRPDDRRPFSFRPLHRCRHNHHHHHHQHDAEGRRLRIPHFSKERRQIPDGEEIFSEEGRQIPYGNDMIVVGGDERRERPYGNDMISEEGRQIPYGDDMIGSDGHRIPARGFGFDGSREDSGFTRWLRDLLNRF